MPSPSLCFPPLGFSLFRACGLGFAVVVGATSAFAASTAPAFSRERATQSIQAHTTFLADDLLEGRGTGTRGHALAGRYVAAQFQRLGLKPAGENGSYEQQLEFTESSDVLDASVLKIHGGRTPSEFVAMNDILARPSAGEESGSVRAPAVFVGFGVRAPELGYDDLGNVDLRGKIAVYYYGAPQTFPVNQRAYYSDGVVKARELVRRGAVGVVVVRLPRDEARYSWAFVVAQSRFPRMKLLDAQGGIVEGFPELKMVGSMSLAATTKLLAASGRDPAAIVAKAERGEAQNFPLGFEIELSGKATVKKTRSMNIVATLPGLDAELAGEPMLVTSHLDHIGIGAPVNGDAIYNGAMDNAIGVSLMLAVAEHLATLPPAPRPVVFAALTGEEKGLLGAEHLARNRLPGIKRFAANLNLDMSLFPAPVRDLVPRGAEHSTLGPLVEKIAGPAGFTISPDPMPDEVIFIRSDQYSFVKTGVPALYLGTGERSSDPNVDLAAATKTFLKTRYHQPTDDLTQSIDWPSTGAFAEVASGFTRAVADDPRAPAWYAGDFFGNTFAEPEARRAPKPGKK